MKLARAQELATMLVNRLAPHCLPDRCCIAGSIRRRKQEVKDIEIVCIPKSTAAAPDLFGGIDAAAAPVRSQDWIRAVYSIGTVVKGHPIDGRYIKLATVDGIAVDVFTAVPRNWGWILALRTGSADFSHYVLLKGLQRRGFNSVDGMIVNAEGESIPVPEEVDLFRSAGVQWVAPEARSI